MPDPGPLRKLADELEAHVTEGEGTAFIRQDDEYDVTIAADRAALVHLAAAFARTAAMAEAEPDKAHTGPFTNIVFKRGSDLSIFFPVYEPVPRPREEPESDRKHALIQGSLIAGCLGVLVLAVIGLVALIRWAL